MPVLVILAAALAVGIALGPRQRYEPVAPGSVDLGLGVSEVDAYLTAKESAVNGLKPDNQARVIWYTPGQKTPYSLVFIHGFSASHAEGLPVHREFCVRYGCNLYLHRLPGHGIQDPDAFLALTPSDLVQSAKEAIAIGQLIGEQVVIMSASTGSTLALYVTRGNPAVRAHIMYSPNVALYSQAAAILTWPWGLQIGRLAFGGMHREFDAPPDARQYWTTRYRLEGLVSLEHLLKATMTDDTLAGVDRPFFIGYYYKDETAFDDIVSIDAMRRLYEMSSTPAAAKRFVAFPDVGTHILSSSFWSRDIESVRRETFQFVDDVLTLPVLSETLVRRSDAAR
jgi:pimeloyl-ACP methyl ester carboxylesterase